MTMPVPGDWTYTGDPKSSDVDAVRFLIPDTDESFRLLSDLEIQYLIDEWYSVYDSLIWVAAEAAELIAGKWAGVVTVSADGVSADVSTLSEKFERRAARLRQTYQDAQEAGSEIDISNLLIDAHLDASIQPLTFARNMHDNPGAGQQDYGGQVYVPIWVESQDG